MLSCWHTLLWACNAPLEYEPIRLEALPRHGRGLAVCPLQRFVRRLAGPRRPHLLGFITWTYRPYKPESSLLRWACMHTLWEQSCQRLLDRNALRLSDWHPAYSGFELSIQESNGTITQAEHDLYEFSLFSLEYTTNFPMGINAYGGIYSRSSTLARHDWIEFPYASLSRRSTSGVSTGNVLGYYRNLGSLRYETSTAYFAVPGSCTTQSSLQSK